MNAPEGDGTTALHWAVHADDLQMVTALIKAGATSDRRESLGVDADGAGGHQRKRRRCSGVARRPAPIPTMLRRGRNRPDDGGAHRQPAAVNVLLKAGAGVNATEAWRGETALMWAAAENHGGRGHGCSSSAAPQWMRSRAR